MSDGPWKSLPMRPHWKKVAKQAEREAFSREELSGTLQAALWKEAAELPLRAVWCLVAPNPQGVLFRPDMDAEIEALRCDHPGSKVVQTFLTCVLDEEANGSSGREMLESAVGDTLAECARDAARTIREHYHRDNGSSEVPVPRRLESALRLCDLRALASQTLAASDSSASSPSPAKRSGVDEGPLL